MAGIIYELMGVLEDQKECYEGLLTLAKYKTDAIVNKDIKLLTEVMDSEEQFVGRVQQLDEKREGYLKDIALVTGLPYKGITVTMIIEKMGNSLDISQQLVELKNQLVEIIEKLKVQNDLNKQLLQQSLEFVDFTINAIKTTQLMPMNVNYGREGDTSIEGPISFFDHKQ
ncbi:MAG: flagellar protein FlgN [Cellulosilyticaceae bacterium]